MDCKIKNKKHFGFIRKELIINDCWYKVKSNCNSCNDLTKKWYITALEFAHEPPTTKTIILPLLPVVVTPDDVEIAKHYDDHAQESSIEQIAVDKTKKKLDQLVSNLSPTPKNQESEKSVKNSSDTSTNLQNKLSAVNNRRELTDKEKNSSKTSDEYIDNSTSLPRFALDEKFDVFQISDETTIVSSTEHSNVDLNTDKLCKVNSSCEIMDILSRAKNQRNTALPYIEQTSNRSKEKETECCIILDDDDDDDDDYIEIIQTNERNLQNKGPLEYSTTLLNNANLNNQFREYTQKVTTQRSAIETYDDQVNLLRFNQADNYRIPTVEFSTKESQIIEYVVRHEQPENIYDEDAELTLAELQEKNQRAVSYIAKQTSISEKAILCIDISDDDNDENDVANNNRVANNEHEKDFNVDCFWSEWQNQCDGQQTTADIPAYDHNDGNITKNVDHILNNVIDLEIMERSTSPDLPKIIEKNNPVEEKIAPDIINVEKSNEQRQCHGCMKFFERKCKLLHHLRNNEKCTDIINNTLELLPTVNTKPYECDICHKTFSSLVIIGRHMYRVHSGSKLRMCRYCTKTFPTPKALRRHSKSHLNKKDQFKCNKCGLLFSTSQSLQNHVSFHTGEKPFECNVCFKKFRISGGLKQHMNVHTNVRPYKCKICHKSFAQTSSLTAHHYIHTGNKPYPCEMCTKSFSSKRYLMEHIEGRHSAIEKPYKCDICQVSSCSISSLRFHMRRHSNTLRISCPICLKTFSHRSGMEIHKKRKHERNWLTCDICNGFERNLKCMERHMMNMHNSGNKLRELRYECKYCKKNFRQYMGMYQHIRLNHKQLNQYFHCDICRKTFALERNLINHRKIHENEENPKPAINVDDAADGIISDYDVEIDRKPFKCTICVMVFSSETNLERHMDLHRKPGRPLKQRYCNICNNSFLMSLKSFIAHQQSHSTTIAIDTPYKCKKCSRSFAEKEQLISHEYIHQPKTSDNRYKCNKCSNNKTFATLLQLREHMNYHTGNLKYECKYCNKRFYKYISMYHHIRVNHKFNEYNCNICDKSFARQSTLIDHRKTHQETTVASINCSFCDYEFLNSKQLMKHMNIHMNDKPYLCTICYERFTKLSDLKSHCYLHNDTVHKFQCDICLKMFANDGALSNHVKLHLRTKTYECNKCQKKITTKLGLQNHMLRHNRKRRPFGCKLCPKRFLTKITLNSHERRHSDNDEPQREKLECPVCQKIFYKLQSFDNHLRRHTKSK